MAISSATPGRSAHAHPDLEQATYVIEGEASVEVDGVRQRVSAGDLLFFPAKVFHDIQVISERIKLLVIYAPPYGEDPAKVIDFGRSIPMPLRQSVFVTQPRRWDDRRGWQGRW